MFYVLATETKFVNTLGTGSCADTIHEVWLEVRLHVPPELPHRGDSIGQGQVVIVYGINTKTVASGASGSRRG